MMRTPPDFSTQASTALSIDLMTGLCFFILGLSLLFRPRAWADWADHLNAKGANAALVLGMVNLLLGSFILAFHWVWTGVGAIVTLFGVLFTLRGSVLLLFPSVFSRVLTWMLARFERLFRLSGLVVAVLGLIILYDGLHHIRFFYAGMMNAG